MATGRRATGPATGAGGRGRTWARRPSGRVRRTPLAAALVGVLAVLSVLFSVQPTSSAWTDPAFMTSSGATGFWLPWYGQARLNNTTLCLDVPSRTDAAGQALQLYACNSTPAQIWFFDADHRVRVFVMGQYSATDGATIRCLRYNGSGSAVTIQNCTTANNEKWTVTAVSGGFQISSVDTPTQCVDVPSSSQTQGTAVVTTSCTAANRTRVWDLEFVATISYA
ncbi:MAG TPA: RICIN domain-containing protein [Cellulomonas sp.]